MFKPIDVSRIITEDDEPVGNLFSEKQQRLAVQSLYANDVIERPFVAAANVGVFLDPKIPPVVPDVFLSLNVQIADDWYAKEQRTDFLWEFGKPPDVALEVVSNKKGGELEKRPKYARIGVQYYIIYDPQRHILTEPIHVYELIGNEYRLKNDWILDDIGIGITLWDGVFEEKDGQWLRWFGPDGALLLTGDEKAEKAEERADMAEDRAEVAESRAEVAESRASEAESRANEAENRAERLAEQLRQLGIDLNPI